MFYFPRLRSIEEEIVGKNARDGGCARCMKVAAIDLFPI